MENIIIIVILVSVIGGVVWYLRKAKKRGETCIGCPYSKQCGSKSDGSCHSMKTDTGENNK